MTLLVAQLLLQSVLRLAEALGRGRT